MPRCLLHILLPHILDLEHKLDAESFWLGFFSDVNRNMK